MTRPVLRVPQSTTCLAVVSGPLPQRRVESLASLYADVLPGSRASRAEVGQVGRAHIVLVGATAMPTFDIAVAWGCPVGAGGAATDTEIHRALEEPDAHAAELAGVFVLAQLDDHGLRVVTSAAMPHTLRHVGGGPTQAWATRGLMAHVLAGQRPRIDEGVVAEQVMFDHVLGSDELLHGTRICAEATALDIDADGVVERQWWPRARRLARAEAPSSGADVREAVGEVARRYARVPGVRLGLTGGRDSRLVLGALGRAGVAIPTITMGRSDFPDVVAAARVAKRSRVEHHVAAPVETAFQDPLQELCRWSTWNEGMEPPSNYLAGWPDMGGREAVLMTGHGGEIGRAYHWKKATPTELERPTCALMAEQWGETRPEVARAALERAERLIDEMRQPGLSSTQLLDRFYATNRMHSWVGRLLPDPSVAGYLPVYLEPAVVSVLLALPEELRATGAAFDPTLGSPLRRHLQRASRLPARIRNRSTISGSSQPSVEMRLLQGLVDELAGRSLCAEVLGKRWVRAARASAPVSPRWRKALWNAVGVDIAALSMQRWVS